MIWLCVILKIILAEINLNALDIFIRETMAEHNIPGVTFGRIQKISLKITFNLIKIV